MTANPPDPFAPGAAVDHDEAAAAPRKPARWLAVVGTIVAFYPLLGVGHFVLGRPRRWAGWAAVGLAALTLMTIAVRTSSAKLFAVAVVAMVLAFFTCVIDVAVMRPGMAAPPVRRALVMVACVFLAGRGLGAATKHWLAEAFNIPSSSMIPSLLAGDHIMVKKGHAVERGAAIVFKYPRDPSLEYVKRVIALGGEVVEIQNGVVAINGTPLHQTAIDDEISCADSGDRCSVVREENGAHSYMVAMTQGRPRGAFGPFTVPAGQVFVLGDNRDNSSDSRVWGGVPEAYVSGTVALIYWSARWNHIATVPQ